MSNDGSVGSSSAGSSGSCGCVSVGSVDGSGSDAFGGVVSVGLLTVGGVSSFSGVETSGCASFISGSTILSAETSVLPETETAVLPCGTVLCTGSAVTVSCKDGADTSECPAFAHPERESASSTKTTMILAFFICANLLCSFIVRITAGNCKAVSAAAAVTSLFSGSTGSFEGVRCGEGEHADTAVHPLKMGMAAPW